MLYRCGKEPQALSALTHRVELNKHLAGTVRVLKSGEGTKSLRRQIKCPGLIAGLSRSGAEVALSRCSGCPSDTPRLWDRLHQCCSLAERNWKCQDAVGL